MEASVREFESHHPDQKNTMTRLENFAKGLDDFVKANKEIQPQDSGLLTISYEYLVNLVIEHDKIAESGAKELRKKLKIIKDVLDL